MVFFLWLKLFTKSVRNTKKNSLFFATQIFSVPIPDTSLNPQNKRSCGSRVRSLVNKILHLIVNLVGSRMQVEVKLFFL